MKKSRIEIQAEAVEALIKNGGGCVNLMAGSGKSKILIDFLMKTANLYDTVLLTVPLTVLIENWIKEYQKWTDCDVDGDVVTVVIPNGYFTVYISTIQAAYKQSYDVTYLVVDK